MAPPVRDFSVAAEPASEHIKNALAVVRLELGIINYPCPLRESFQMIERRLTAALEQLEALR